MYSITSLLGLQFDLNGFIPVTQNPGNYTPAGSIESYTMTNNGSNYVGTTVACTITGDGTSATAVGYISGGQITHIEPTAGGSGYTWANITIPAPTGAGGGTTAAAQPNLAPQGGHGFDNISELVARFVMVSETIQGSESSKISVAASYRMLAIVRNPTLYGGSTIATGTAYNLTTTLAVVTVSGTFISGETIRDNVTGIILASVVEWNAGTGNLYVNNIFGTMVGGGSQTIRGITSGATATINTITNPDLNPYSGKVLYYETFSPVARSSTQQETLVTVFKF
jgi:hypothetical protein